MNGNKLVHNYHAYAYGADFMLYEILLNECCSQGIIVREKPLIANKGRQKGNMIAIKKDIPSTVEKACILAEELGHFHTTTGTILDETILTNKKQELYARAWAYKKLIPLTKFITAHKNGITSRHDLADFFHVTEDFLEEAITYYFSKHGLSKKIGDYEVFFNPLQVKEIKGGIK